MANFALAEWLSWLDHQTNTLVYTLTHWCTAFCVHQKAVGSIPTQGTDLCCGCWFNPLLGRIQETTDRYFPFT